MEFIKKVLAFNLTEKLLSVTTFGAEWVLWLLFILSLISVTFLIERGVYYRMMRSRIDAWYPTFKELIFVKNWEEAKKFLLKQKGIEVEILLAGVIEQRKTTDHLLAAMNSVKSRVKNQLERGLGYLGTLGANAPFIGLFGTVLGVIRAFKNLSAIQNNNQSTGMEAVMGSLGEALIATAVGLLVAIPSVVAYNIYTRKVRKMVAQIDAGVQMSLPDLVDEKINFSSNHKGD